MFYRKDKPAEGNIDMHGMGIEEIKNISSGVRINYITGVIQSEDSLRFKRMIFRITRGNAWTDFADI